MTEAPSSDVIWLHGFFPRTHDWQFLRIRICTRNCELIQLATEFHVLQNTLAVVVAPMCMQSRTVLADTSERQSLGSSEVYLACVWHAVYSMTSARAK